VYVSIGFYLEELAFEWEESFLKLPAKPKILTIFSIKISFLHEKVNFHRPVLDGLEC